MAPQVHIGTINSIDDPGRLNLNPKFVGRGPGQSNFIQKMGDRPQLDLKYFSHKLIPMPKKSMPTILNRMMGTVKKSNVQNASILKQLRKIKSVVKSLTKGRR